MHWMWCIEVSKETAGLGIGGPMITLSNQACSAKISGCELQEGSLAHLCLPAAPGIVLRNPGKIE